MSSPIPAAPGATVISINAHRSRFPVDTFAHHNIHGFCEIVGAPAQFGQRTVRSENHQDNRAQVWTADVDVEELQELTEWREYRGMLSAGA